MSKFKSQAKEKILDIELTFEELKKQCQSEFKVFGLVLPAFRLSRELYFMHVNSLLNKFINDSAQAAYYIIQDQNLRKPKTEIDCFEILLESYLASKMLPYQMKVLIDFREEAQLRVENRITVDDLREKLSYMQIVIKEFNSIYNNS